MHARTPHASSPGRFAVAALLSLLVAAPAAAQPAGSIDGAVVDANGTPLPGVVVTVTGPGGREERVTSAAGAYTAAGLAAGDYVVTAMLPGFETVEVPVSLGAGATATVPIVLRVTRLLATVSVIAEAPRIFARNVVADPMMRQQSNITSVTAVVDNLPGVSIQEGDAYGFDDLVEPRRHAGLPGDQQRGADRHHHRRIPERHIRLLQRRQGEPVHRPDEPRRG